MRYLIRRHPPRPVHLPAPSHRPTASRPASRRTVSPNGSARNTTPSYTLPALSACHHLTHRPISSAHSFRPLLARLVPPPAVAIRLPPHAAHPSHPTRPISSAHLPSRSASRSASRRASSLVSSRLTSRHVSSTLLANLIRLVHLIHLIRLIGSSPTPHRIRRATSRRNGAHDGQSTTGKKERHDTRQLTDTANTPPRPPYSPYEPHNARTLTRTRPQENAPYMPITTPLTGNTR